MAIGKKQRQSLPIETEAYKKEQEFLRESAIKDRLDAGEIITNPADFPKGTPSDVTAVSRGKNVTLVNRLPAAKAKNSKTTANIKNPPKKSSAQQETTEMKTATKTAAKKAAKAPAKKAAASASEGRGRTSVYSGKTLYTKLTENPRRAGTAGHAFFAVVLKAGKKGITYEALKASPHFGNNHLAWDVERGNIVAK